MKKKIETAEVKPLEQEIVVLEKEVNTFLGKADALVIANDDDYSSATDLVGVINEKKKNIETMRKFFVDPLNKQVKDINAMFKPQVEQADEIIDTIKGKMGVYYRAKEDARIKEEKRLQDIRDKANAKREAQGKEAIAEPVREVAEVAKTVTADNTQSTVRKVWKHQIISIDALPDDVKKAIFAEAYTKGIIDTVVRKFVNAGIREMSGVKIYEDVQIAVRS